MIDPAAIDMGRYGAFVWPAYGISALVLLGFVADTLVRSASWRRRAERAEAARREARAEPRAGR